jgi:hypothetical protein
MKSDTKLGNFEDVLEGTSPPETHWLVVESIRERKLALQRN